MAEAKPKNIHQKMLDVMNAVEKIPKRGHNKFHNYDYATESDVLEGVRGALVEQGLMVYPSCREDTTTQRTSGDKVTTERRVLMDFTFVNAADPSETMVVTFPGDAHDVGDKAIYKALTGAEKQAMMKTFMIPTGDDPETSGSGEQAPAESKPRQSPGSTISKAQAALLNIWFDIAGVPENYSARVKSSLGIENWTQATKEQMDAVKAKLVDAGQLAFEKDNQGKDVAYNPKDRGGYDADTP
jgi:hypothetical protein